VGCKKQTHTAQRKEIAMEQVYYAGLDIHKKIIAFCIKQADGTIVAEDKI
jgi:hypothetical protein